MSSTFGAVRHWLAVAVLSALAAAPSQAADLTGKWTWISRFNDTEVKNTAEFKQAGDKITGVYIRDDQKTEIKDAKLTKENEVSFSVVRERNGQQFVIRHVGKLDGDTIRGKRIVTIDGNDRESEWEAKRVKESGLTGNWTWIVVVDGNEFKNTAEFKEEGGKLTGSVVGRNNQKSEIRDGKVAGQEVSFVVIRERDGQEIKIQYKGKLDGGTIKGKISLNIGGENRELDWEAKRG